MSLLKKALELSTPTNAEIELKIYNPEDQSLLEYFSSKPGQLSSVTRSSSKVNDYSKFTNEHLDLVSELYRKITKRGSLDKTDKELYILEDR